MAIDKKTFSLDKGLLANAITSAVIEFMDDRSTGEAAVREGGLATYLGDQGVFIDLEEEVNSYFAEIEETVDNPDEISSDFADFEEDEDNYTFGIDVTIPDEEPEDTQSLADSLDAVPAVSTTASLLAVLNRLGLTVDKKNRILAIVGE